MQQVKDCPPFHSMPLLPGEHIHQWKITEIKSKEVTLLNFPKAKVEGQKMDCPNCGKQVIARLKSYKNDMYPAYIQWQSLEENKAHLDSQGNCLVQQDDTEGTDWTKKDADVTISKIPSFDESTKLMVCGETLVLLQLNNTILEFVKTMEVDPSPAKIGQFTKILYDKHFQKNFKKASEVKE